MVMEWRKEPSVRMISSRSLRVQMGPEMKVPSARAVKLAWSQSIAPSKEVETEELMIGNVIEATSVMDAPAPKSRIAMAAKEGRKAAPLDVMARDPSSPRVSD